MKVSIIIPAYNAADTISETIISIQAQTFKDWEAIIVDDGSTDNTKDIISKFSEKDDRIKTVNGVHQGVSAARNIGINASKNEWLFFIDSDDWIGANHLERFLDKLATDPKTKIMYCDYCRVDPDGKCFGGNEIRKSGQLFNDFAVTCVTAIHSILVHRSLIEEVGNFDTSLKTCEDWDLWQRIARTGVHFEFIPGITSYYRTRPTSASNNALQLMKDGMRVIERGHSKDSRVKNPKPEYKNGLSRKLYCINRYYFTIWTAALAIGKGDGFKPIMDYLEEYPCPSIDPYSIADILYEGILLPKCNKAEDWVDLLPSLSNEIDSLLDEIERKSTAIRFKQKVKKIFEIKIVSNVKINEPVQVGECYAKKFEISQDISDLYFHQSVHQLYGQVYYNSIRVGTFTLPVFDSFISADIIRDTIAHECSWNILSKYFQNSVYRNLIIEKTNDRLIIKREETILLDTLYKKEKIDWDEIHNYIGWHVFLQEIWNLPKWHLNDFYIQQVNDISSNEITVGNNPIIIDISDLPACIKTKADKLSAIISVCGEPIGIINFEAKNKPISLSQLRTEITAKTGYDLCRSIVKNTIISSQLSNDISLYERITSLSYLSKQPTFINRESSDEILCAGYDEAAYKNTFIIGRRNPDKFGTNASRIASFPKSLTEEILTIANNNNDIIKKNYEGDSPDRIIYDPRLIHIPLNAKSEETLKKSLIKNPNSDEELSKELFGTMVGHFDYNSEYEQIKYYQVLSLIPKTEINNALELGCDEGHFTVRLAPKVKKLTVIDISQIALRKTKERCKLFNHIDYQQLDISKNTIPGKFDLIICNEMFSYLKNKDELEVVANKIVDSLSSNGIIIMAHENNIVDDPDNIGFNWDVPFGDKTIKETFSSINSLVLKKEINTPLYHIYLFKKNSLLKVLQFPQKINLPLKANLTYEIFSQIDWKGREPHKNNSSPLVTNQLPILMYHRVASSGSVLTSRYRVNPQMFYKQIKYLAESGYYSTTFEEWEKAIFNKRPLPGKAIILTFDDGFKDFYTNALPVLKEFGFSAVVFIVAEDAGKNNIWDKSYGEVIELMNWDEIQNLLSSGIQIGSHTSNHPSLISLSPTEVLKEAITSLSILERELGLRINSFAYPYGDFNELIKHIIGACGYLYGVTCQSRYSRLNDSLLSLPRIEIFGSDGIKEFKEKLNYQQL